MKLSQLLPIIIANVRIGVFSPDYIYTVYESSKLSEYLEDGTVADRNIDVINPAPENGITIYLKEA